MCSEPSDWNSFTKDPNWTIRYANFFQRKYYAFAKNTEPPNPSSFKICLSFCWGAIGLCFVDCSDDLCPFGLFFVSSSLGGGLMGWFAVFWGIIFFSFNKTPGFLCTIKSHPLKKRVGKKRPRIIIIQCKDGGLNTPRIGFKDSWFVHDFGCLHSLYVCFCFEKKRTF